jgi:hypothetical protein
MLMGSPACKHHYSKINIYQLFEQQDGRNKKAAIKCPSVGCGQKVQFNTLQVGFPSQSQTQTQQWLMVYSPISSSSSGRTSTSGNSRKRPTRTSRTLRRTEAGGHSVIQEHDYHLVDMH